MQLAKKDEGNPAIERPAPSIVGRSSRRNQLDVKSRIWIVDEEALVPHGACPALAELLGARPSSDRVGVLSRSSLTSLVPALASSGLSPLSCFDFVFAENGLVRYYPTTDGRVRASGNEPVRVAALLQRLPNLLAKAVNRGKRVFSTDVGTVEVDDQRLSYVCRKQVEALLQKHTAPAAAGDTTNPKAATTGRTSSIEVRLASGVEKDRFLAGYDEEIGPGNCQLEVDDERQRAYLWPAGVRRNCCVGLLLRHYLHEQEKPYAWPLGVQYLSAAAWRQHANWALVCDESIEASHETLEPTAVRAVLSRAWPPGHAAAAAAATTLPRRIDTRTTVNGGDETPPSAACMRTRWRSLFVDWDALLLPGGRLGARVLSCLERLRACKRAGQWWVLAPRLSSHEARLVLSLLPVAGIIAEGGLETIVAAGAGRPGHNKTSGPPPSLGGKPQQRATPTTGSPVVDAVVALAAAEEGDLDTTFWPSVLYVGQDEDCCKWFHHSIWVAAAAAGPEAHQPKKAPARFSPRYLYPRTAVKVQGGAAEHSIVTVLRQLAVAAAEAPLPQQASTAKASGGLVEAGALIILLAQRELAANERERTAAALEAAARHLSAAWSPTVVAANVVRRERRGGDAPEGRWSRVVRASVDLAGDPPHQRQVSAVLNAAVLVGTMLRRGAADPPAAWIVFLDAASLVPPQFFVNLDMHVRQVTRGFFLGELVGVDASRTSADVIAAAPWSVLALPRVPTRPATDELKDPRFPDILNVEAHEHPWGFARLENLTVSSGELEAVGGWDEQFDQGTDGGHDVDLAYRLAKKRKLVPKFLPGSEVYWQQPARTTKAAAAESQQRGQTTRPEKLNSAASGSDQPVTGTETAATDDDSRRNSRLLFARIPNYQKFASTSDQRLPTPSYDVHVRGSPGVNRY